MPVYDARNIDFSFDEAGFHLIHNLPTYRPVGTHQLMDLPVDSVVAVAYTVNIWGIPEPSSSDLPNLSLNIQFVLLLGMLL